MYHSVLSCSVLLRYFKKFTLIKIYANLFTSNSTLFGSVTLSLIHFNFVKVRMNPMAIFPIIQVVVGLFAISEAFVFSDIVEWNSYKVTMTVHGTVRIRRWLSSVS